MLPEACALCLRAAVLRVSHVIPSFIGRWLKATSPSPKFRSSEQPNKTVQDVPKLPLLCDDCEQKVGKYETAFKLSAFDRLFASRSADPRLLVKGLLDVPSQEVGQFALSLLFRVACHEIRARVVSPEDRQALERAFEVWRPTLLGAPAVSELTVIVAQSPHVEEILKRAGLFGRRFRYTLRDIEMGLEFTTASLADGPESSQPGLHLSVVYAKIPGFAFFAIHGLPAGVSPSQSLLNDLVVRRLAVTGQKIESLPQRMSDRQLQASREGLARDLGNKSISNAVRCALLDEFQRSTGIWL